jgi:hypothetical protein
VDIVHRRSWRLLLPAGAALLRHRSRRRPLDKIRVGRNRREAERALRKVAVSIDESAYHPQLNVGFAQWAERWLSSLERQGQHDSLLRPHHWVRHADISGEAGEATLSGRHSDFQSVGPRPGAYGVDSRQAPPRARRLPPECRSAWLCEHESGARASTRREAASRKKRGRLLRKRRDSKALCRFPDRDGETIFLLALKTGMRQVEILLPSRSQRTSMATGNARNEKPRRTG